MELATFERFEIEMPIDAVMDCSHQGECDADVGFWATMIERPAQCTPERLRAELRGYGAWDDDQLADDGDNWHRIVWIAAGDIKENIREMERETEKLGG